MRLIHAFIVASCLSITFLPCVDRPCCGQEKAVLDPKKADADFAFQGEYVGEVTGGNGTMKIGIQVVALGAGRFLGVGYFGGLPGDGWNGTEPLRNEATVKDGVLAFAGGADVRIKDDVVTIRDNGGNPHGECKKVLRKSLSLGEKPPADAIVLFDGKSADHFTGKPAKNNLLDGDMLIEGVVSNQEFQNFTLHFEFQLSYMPSEKEQRRANSGCYCQGRYEVQILDSFGLKGENNECGGIYGVKKPDVNMCFPPLSWQTYDIEFTAAKYDSEGKKTANARMNVRHNGVPIHKDVEIPKTTTAAPNKEGANPGPIYLQDHGNPIRFRNIWIVEKK